jgi:hypothetical protein
MCEFKWIKAQVKEDQGKFIEIFKEKYWNEYKTMAKKT